MRLSRRDHEHADNFPVAGEPDPVNLIGTGLTLIATAPGDAKGDLIVSIADLGLLGANFNGGFNTLAVAAESFGTTTPEPGAATMLLVVAGVVWHRSGGV